MQTLAQANKHAADLHWLAFLLTGRRELSVDIAIETIASQEFVSSYFSTRMLAWSRRLVMAKALAAIRHELAASARRTGWKRRHQSTLPASGWSLAPGTTKADLEKALLAIDVFPRTALLLSIFEGVPIADAAVLLDADPALVRKARAIGLRELTGNLARTQGWTSSPARLAVVHGEA